MEDLFKLLDRLRVATQMVGLVLEILLAALDHEKITHVVVYMAV